MPETPKTIKCNENKTFANEPKERHAFELWINYEHIFFKCLASIKQQNLIEITHLKWDEGHFKHLNMN